VREARHASNVQDEVRLLGGVLEMVESLGSRVESQNQDCDAGAFLALNSRPSTLNPFVLGVWRICTRPCEGRRPGSTPGEDTLLTSPERLEVCGLRYALRGSIAGPLPVC
jgi:hypothetical protein